ncbi:hypothetical protein ACJX0J_015291, partial [Zea mays]
LDFTCLLPRILYRFWFLSTKTFSIFIFNKLLPNDAILLKNIGEGHEFKRLEFANILLGTLYLVVVAYFIFEHLEYSRRTTAKYYFISIFLIHFSLLPRINFKEYKRLTTT